MIPEALRVKTSGQNRSPAHQERNCVFPKGREPGKGLERPLRREES